MYRHKFQQRKWCRNFGVGQARRMSYSTVISEDRQKASLQWPQQKEGRSGMHQVHSRLMGCNATLNIPLLRLHYPGAASRLSLFWLWFSGHYFDSVDTNGAAEPSCLDAFSWRRLCSPFQRALENLRKVLAGCAKCIACKFIDPNCILPLLTCRLVALVKCPGVSLTGIGEIPWHKMGKAILSVVRDDAWQATGFMQLCACQVSGLGAAVHVIRDSFQKEETEAAILVDTDNALIAWIIELLWYCSLHLSPFSHHLV